MQNIISNCLSSAPALAALLVGLFIASWLPAAEPQSITIKELTNRRFAPDLVNYAVDAPKDGGRNLRVIDANASCWVSCARPPGRASRWKSGVNSATTTSCPE